MHWDCFHDLNTCTSMHYILDIHTCSIVFNNNTSDNDDNTRVYSYSLDIHIRSRVVSSNTSSSDNSSTVPKP